MIVYLDKYSNRNLPFILFAYMNRCCPTPTILSVLTTLLSQHMNLNLALAGRSQAALSYFGICVQRPPPSSSSSSSPTALRSSLHQQVLDKTKQPFTGITQHRYFPSDPKYNLHPRSRDARTDGASVCPPGGEASLTEYKSYTNKRRLQ